MTKLKHQVKKYTKRTIEFLKKPETKRGYKKGLTTVNRFFKGTGEGINETLGLPEREFQHNTVRNMSHGLMRTLPERKRNVGRVVVRRPRYDLYI